MSKAATVGDIIGTAESTLLEWEADVGQRYLDYVTLSWLSKNAARIAATTTHNDDAASALVGFFHDEVLRQRRLPWHCPGQKALTVKG
jgi:hypothetical protein